MPQPNVLLIVIDGLRASALGAYGNTTSPTASLDHFAAQSMLADWCYAASPDLAAIYGALWRSSETAASLPVHFSSNNYATSLVTDDPLLETFAGANDFEQHVQLADVESRRSQRRAVAVGETRFAELFASASELITNSDSARPQFIWLHSRGMYGPWDAPMELQESLLDEEDPPPVETVQPPDCLLSSQDGPDEAFRYASAYAAQAMVLDDCFAILMQTISSRADKPWLIVLLGARGFPLGEHQRIGGIDPRLYGEQLHVPWICRFPDTASRLARNPWLTTHSDLASLLLASTAQPDFGYLAKNALASKGESLFAVSPNGHRAIRTPDWCLRLDPSATVNAMTDIPGVEPFSGAELFVRPDDRWEANDVAKLCPDVVENLTAELGAQLDAGMPDR